MSRGVKYLHQIDSRTVIPLNGRQSSYLRKPLLNGLNGHLPTITEAAKPTTNGHLPTIKTQPAQFVTPAVELRTSA
jgi:hypothetical protein